MTGYTAYHNAGLDVRPSGLSSPVGFVRTPVLTIVPTMSTPSSDAPSPATPSSTADSDFVDSSDPFVDSDAAAASRPSSSSSRTKKRTAKKPSTPRKTSSATKKSSIPKKPARGKSKLGIASPASASSSRSSPAPLAGGENDYTNANLEVLLKREEELQGMIDELVGEIEKLETQLSEKEGNAVELDDQDINYEEFEAPQWCVPIKANVLDFEWDTLAATCQFDVICMDPPWQLASSAPTRGVAIGYQQLPDQLIEGLPIEKLQTNGFIFIWVINNKYTRAFELMEKWGYTYVDDITWVKQTVNRRMAKGHGYYLQHAKETCLVGRKGEDPPGCRHGFGSDVIFSERRGQSQKPEELYAMIEEMVPNGASLDSCLQFETVWDVG
ncbi:hypothetical protein HK104_006909 [Borealophlyctis nickersoniae]|nr:hypothetical protein HK104_006909 [Borealophlyctis nickersoniae]